MTMSNANDTPQNSNWKAALCKEIEARFNLTELKGLCGELSIDYEEIPGNNKSEKTQEFVDYIERRGMERKLFDKLIELRPTVTWPTPSSSSRFLSKDPRKARGLVKRGNVFLTLQKYDLVIEVCTEALNFDETAQIYAQRAAAYKGKGEYELALDDVNQAIYLSPSKVTFLMRGLIYHFQGKDLEAIADFDDATKLGGLFPNSAYVYWGISYFREGMQEKALFYFNRFIKEGGDSDLLYLARLHRAAIFRKRKKYPKALTDYNQAIRLDRDEPSTYYFRGHIHRKMGVREKARMDFERFLELSNDLEKKEEVIHWLEELKDEEKQ